jgi:hypothetical protein
MLALMALAAVVQDVLTLAVALQAATAAAAL